MRMLKITSLSIAALAGIVVAASPAAARPRHRVCHMERHHGHPVRVCHWGR